MMRILIVKTSALGDILHAYPVLSYFQAYYPEASIDWVVEEPFAPLLETHPFVNKVFKIASKRWRRALLTKAAWQEMRAFRRSLQQKRYDFVFDLQGNCKSGAVTWLARAAKKVGFGVETVPERPNTWVTTVKVDPPQEGNIRHEPLYLVQHTLEDFRPAPPSREILRLKGDEEEVLRARFETLEGEGDRFVVVCPGSQWENKKLPPEVLAQLLLTSCHMTGVRYALVWGSEQERREAEGIAGVLGDSAVVLDKMPLPVLQNLMARVGGVVAMDSLPLHLAETAGTPTWSVYGPSSAAKYAPQGEGHAAFQGACPYGETFVRRCPKLRTCPTGACIRSLVPEDLQGHFTEWLKKVVGDL